MTRLARYELETAAELLAPLAEFDARELYLGAGCRSLFNIPAAVKRTVWRRDGGRCAFAGESGRRCTARGFLEFHHVRPYGIGGEATADNIQIRCRRHNAYEADLFYGRLVPERVDGRAKEETPRR